MIRHAGTIKFKLECRSRARRLTVKVKNMGIANIAGMFSVFEGQVMSNSEDFADALVTLEIDAKSITTNHYTRYEHLRSNFLFDTERFTKLGFKGSLRKSTDDYEQVGE